MFATQGTFVNAPRLTQHSFTFDTINTQLLNFYLIFKGFESQEVRYRKGATFLTKMVLNYCRIGWRDTAFPASRTLRSECSGMNAKSFWSVATKVCQNQEIC